MSEVPSPARVRLRETLDLLRTWAVALPPALVAGWSLRADEPPAHAGWILAGAVGVSGLLAVSLRQAFARRLRTVSSVLAAYREGDYSIRARAHRGEEMLTDVLVELNQLGEKLRGHRLGELEAWALLRKVMAEVDVVVLAFDGAGRVKLANNAATRLLAAGATRVVGELAEDLGLADLLTGAAPRLVKDDARPGAGASPAARYRGHPWELRRGTFRLSGEPHQLVVLSDVAAVSRDAEREAWRRLIRVMGHEINNSLAPIGSIAETLLAQSRRDPVPDDWRQDVVQGLEVIGRRAEGLARFMTSYASLARLPAPELAPVDLGPLLREVAHLDRRATITFRPGPDVVVSADRAQLEQALVNLVKNAIDAMAGAPGEIIVRWDAEVDWVEIAIEDDGPGVGETTNLFVPFFTTKSDGSGIGLVLSRQIVEAHGGQLSLASREDRRGAVARVRLPLPG